MSYLASGFGGREIETTAAPSKGLPAILTRGTSPEAVGAWLRSRMSAQNSPVRGWAEGAWRDVECSPRIFQ